MNQLKIKGVYKIEANAHPCVGGDTVNQQEVLIALPSREEDAKSMKEIALEMGLEISSYTKWIRVERNLCRVLRKLIKWNEVTCARRQNTDGHRFWYTVYWKTGLPQQEVVFNLEVEA